jgi:hypothetical protein
VTDDIQPSEERLHWQDFEQDLMELCRIKAGDFHLLGYAEVSPQDIWRCVQHMTKGKGSLSDLVSTILGLKIGQLMNFLTINAYKGVFYEDGV